MDLLLQFPLIQRLFLSDWEEDEYAKRVFVGPNKVWPHPETPAKGEFEVSPPKGKVYDKKPFPITLKAGKKYAWCVCGHSKSQVRITSGFCFLMFTTLWANSAFSR